MNTAELPKNEKETTLSLVPQGGIKPAAAEAESEMEIDLIELGYVLLDKIHYIILALLAGAVLVNAWSYFMIKPTYQTTGKMYIVSSSSDSVVDLTDLNIGTSLTKDYEELILSYPVLEQVIEKENLSMDYQELSKMIAISNPTDTRILDITVTATEAKTAKNIANTLMDVAVDYLPKTMNTDEPNIAQKAKTPESKFAPSYAKYTMMGALLGVVLCCMYLIIQYMMDDTIHSPEEMEKYFGLVPLTTIPESEILLDSLKTPQKHKSSAGKTSSGKHPAPGEEKQHHA